MVKVYGKDGKEETFESKKVEDDLKAVGLPQRIAEEVAERLEARVQDGWTSDKIRDETDVELRHLQEAIDKAHASYKGATPMGAHNVGEQRTMCESDNSIDVQPRSETKVECRNIET
ncbi:MAG: hypothetical protein LBI79_00740 [Nitrososphaerota archaeon]|nr:hypothetical protein [Nitrososphaerota archaeon]